MTELDRRSFLGAAAGSLAAMAILPDLAPAAPRAGEPISVGVIGLGRQGLAALAELQKLDACRIAALCDLEEARIVRATRRVQGAQTATDYRALLDNKSIGAIVVATPTHLHRDIAIAAMDAGKHVYCEAPLAHTIEDCAAIAKAARGLSKTVFTAGFESRTDPVYKLARSFFRSGSVGDLASMRAQHNQKDSWRVGGGDAANERALNWRLDPAVSLGLAGEFGAHQFDAAHWFRGSYPVRVRGGGGVRFWKDGREVPDTIRVELEFADGVVLSYAATLVNSFERRYECFYGSNAAMKLAWTHGWLFKEADASTEGWQVYANKQQFFLDEGITLIADATKLANQGKLKEGVGLPNSPLYYALSEFLASAAEGKPGACTGDDAMRSTIIGILANQAVLSGRTVEVDENTLKGG